ILIDSLAIMLAIVVPTIAATLAFAWWFRAANTRATYLPDFEYSGRIELIVWSIPLLTVILLGGVAWIGSHDLDPAKPLASDTPPLEIQGVSLDWKWLFIYPDQRVASVNQLMVPSGVPIHFSLTSASVMSAFFIPPPGGPPPPALGATIAATGSRTCISTCTRCRRLSSPPGSRAPATPVRLSIRRATRPSPGRASTPARSPSA